MAEAENDIEGDGEDAAEAKPKKKLPGKIIVLFIAVPLLIGAIVAAVVFAPGMFRTPQKMALERAAQAQADAAAPQQALPTPPTYFELPDMTVNLSGVEEGRPSYLKVTVALELRVQNPEEVTAQLNALSPRLIDRFQTFLRQLRPEDLDDAASMARLKEEMLRRVNLAIAPVQADDIVFKQLLIQ